MFGYMSEPNTSLCSCNIAHKYAEVHPISISIPNYVGPIGHYLDFLKTQTKPVKQDPKILLNKPSRATIYDQS